LIDYLFNLAAIGIAILPYWSNAHAYIYTYTLQLTKIFTKKTKQDIHLANCQVQLLLIQQMIVAGKLENEKVQLAIYSTNVMQYVETVS